MSSPNSQFDELGLKVQRAQYEVDKIRGTATVGGITVEVDAKNRLVAVDHPDAESILAAYEAALRDKQPKVDEAMRDVLSDPHAQAVSTFLETNDSGEEARRRRIAKTDERYFEKFRQDPLGRNR
ncbi:hypothetical protein GCM10027169_16920 [Gordonia jinhuaensis]|uniref:YbaB/EbfC family nucleoid-associated protein n=1 Tax=Gordonia jinhuaensis TaxID=1517702 RepID=UPI00166F4C70|nr:YbaB/EbfC family nucleoid-associated protein [Gordonia jinhuaensis]